MATLTIYRNLAFITIIVIIAFYPTLSDLMAEWTKFDESQSHGLIVIAMFIHLFIKELKQLPPACVTPNWLGLIALATSSVFWCLAAVLNIETIEQLVLLPIILFLCWSLLGLRSTKALAPSISLLIFVIPIWDYLTPMLVDASSYVVTLFIERSNIVALIDGNSIYLPYGRIDIADGCSGLRYLTIAIALVYYLILTSKTTLTTKVKLLSIAIGLGLITNWLRIYIIIMVAHFTEMQSSLIRDHEIFGWLLFLFICLPLIYFSRTLAIRDQSKKTVTTRASLPKLTICTTIIALASGPTLYAAMNTNVSEHVISDWQQLGYQQLTTPSDSPFQLPRSNINLRKEHDSTIREIAIHWRQSQRSDLVPYISSSLNRDYWTLLQTSDIQVPGQHPLELNLYKRKTVNQFNCTVSWYRVGKTETTNYYVAKLLQIPALLSQQKLFTAAVISINSDTDNCAQYQQQLTDAAIETNTDIVRLTQAVD